MYGKERERESDVAGRQEELIKGRGGYEATCSSGRGQLTGELGQRQDE